MPWGLRSRSRTQRPSQRRTTPSLLLRRRSSRSSGPMARAHSLAHEHVTQFENGTGTGGKIRDDLRAIADAAKGVADSLRPAGNVVKWFFEHPDALKGAADSMVIYAAATKSAALWSALIKPPPLVPG